jgi:YD repeat-containing protein
MKSSVVGPVCSRRHAGASARWRRVLAGVIASVAAVAAFAASVTYEYDAQGRLRKVTHDTGTITSYTLDAAGNRTMVATGVDNVAPTVPSGLAGTPNATPAVVLTWNPSTDPDPSAGFGGYRISRNGTALPDLPGTGTTFTDTGVVGSTTYTYSVAAYDNSGHVSAASNVISVTTPAVVDTSRPTTPGSFAASAQSSTAVRLTWTAATDNVGVTAYVIDRCTGVSCSNYAPLTTWTSGPLQFDNTGLSASTTYGYRIVARDAALNTSATAATAVVTTLADTTKPTVPGSPTATASGATSIHLTWTASTDNVGVVGYLIERCSGSGCSTFTTINGAPITALLFDDTGLTGGTLYRYKIKARDAAGNLSDDTTTPIVSDTTAPSTPSSVGIPPSPNTTGSYTISWTPVGGNTGVGYELQESKNDPLFGTPSIPYTTTATSFPISGKTDGTYSYRVRACNATGCSSYATGGGSVTVSLPDLVKPTTPGSPAASPTSSAGVHLSWTVSSDNIGVVGYMIERCAGVGCSSFSAVNTVPLNALLYDDTGVSGATSYTYRFMARDAAGNNSDPTATVTALTWPAPPSTINIPSGTNTTGAYTITWIQNGGNTGVTYELQESFNDPNFSSPVLYTTTAVSYSFSSKPNGSYSYRVRGCNTTGCSPYTIGGSALAVNVPDTSKPSAPSIPASVGLDSTNVRITWGPSNDNVGVTAYDVYRCTTSTCGASTLIATTAGNVLTANDSVLAGITVYYRIYARDAAGNSSDPSTVVSAMTWPPVPTGITVPNIVSTTGAYDVSWSISSGDSTSTTYELQESKNDSNFGSPVLYSTLGGTVRNVTGRTDGVYYYRVRACNAMGCSGYRTAGNSITVQIPAQTQFTLDPVSVFGQAFTVSDRLIFHYGLASNGFVTLTATGPVSFTGPARNTWLFPVSGMNLYQARATSGCGFKTTETAFGIWQALGTGVTPSWGVQLTAANRSAQCTITIDISAIANPNVVLGTGTINVDMTTFP